MGDDDDTPVLRKRSTGSVTSWGIVEAWLVRDSTRRLEMVTGSSGLHIHLYFGDEFTIEPVSPSEDPSAAAVRAIGRLSR